MLYFFIPPFSPFSPMPVVFLMYNRSMYLCMCTCVHTFIYGYTWSFDNYIYAVKCLCDHFCIKILVYQCLYICICMTPYACANDIGG